MLSVWVVEWWQETTQRRYPYARVSVPREGYLYNNIYTHILLHSSLTFLRKPSKYTPR